MRLTVRLPRNGSTRLRTWRFLTPTRVLAVKILNWSIGLPQFVLEHPNGFDQLPREFVHGFPAPSSWKAVAQAFGQVTGRSLGRAEVLELFEHSL